MADVRENFAPEALVVAIEGAPWIVLEFAPRDARSAATLAPVSIRVSQRNAASAFANCGHTVAYVGSR